MDPVFYNNMISNNNTFQLWNSFIRLWANLHISTIIILSFINKETEVL